MTSQYTWIDFAGASHCSFSQGNCEWLWILLSIALVLAAELFNTALESLANLVSLEFQPLIKKSKDASAAAVLVVSILALLVGVFIFIPKLWDLF